MDPITTAIIGAIVAGAAAGVTDTAKKLIVDSYAAVKAKIVEKYGKDNKISGAIQELESEPEFEPHQNALIGRIEQHQAANDSDLLELVQALQNVLDSQKKQDLTQINISDDAQVGAVGHTVTVSGGITFNKNRS